jgi:menaquinone-dependent protoporphyrinogen oxidase
MLQPKHKKFKEILFARSGIKYRIIDIEHPYQAVVAGSAIQGQKWLPEAMQFLRAHQSELAQKPFAAFMVCITLTMTNADQYREGLKVWMNPVRSLVRPINEGYFAGGLDFSKIPFSFNVLAMRFVVLTGMWKKGDHRDWNAIEAWAKSLRGLLSRQDSA